MKMLIGGKHVDAKGGTTFENRNPFDGTLICTVPNGTGEDFEAAAVIAKEAQKEWAKTPIYIRARILMNFVGLVRRDFDKIVDVVVAEGGKAVAHQRVRHLTRDEASLRSALGAS